MCVAGAKRGGAIEWLGLCSVGRRMVGMQPGLNSGVATLSTPVPGHPGPPPFLLPGPCARAGRTRGVGPDAGSGGGERLAWRVWCVKGNGGEAFVSK